tara:strand:- start:435 stop:743 length:309 start_codon:yes stop_codon:yes gene_type:complete
MRYRKGDKPPGGGGHRTNGPRSLRKGTVRPSNGGFPKQWNAASFRQHYYENPQLQETARRHGMGGNGTVTDGWLCRLYCLVGSDPNPWENCHCKKNTSGQVY